MRAMILAAGRGERMRPLTDHTPKPLLPVAGKPLVVWHLERLAAAGIRDVVINHAWLGHCLEAALGDGSHWGLRLRWSPEPTGGLETAGGIACARPWAGQAPFLVINGDVWCDWNPAAARDVAAGWSTDPQRQAWLLLVDNPVHHPDGDFWLASDGSVHTDPTDTSPAADRLTFSGIGVYHPRLFAEVSPTARVALGPLLRQAMRQGTVRGSRHDGRWVDVGTPERLLALEAALAAGA